MEVSDMSVNEGNTVPVCALLTGRFTDSTEDVVVNLAFTNTLLAGNETI